MTPTPSFSNGPPSFTYFWLFGMAGWPPSVPIRKVTVFDIYTTKWDFGVSRASLGSCVHCDYPVFRLLIGEWNHVREIAEAGYLRQASTTFSFFPLSSSFSILFSHIMSNVPTFETINITLSSTGTAELCFSRPERYNSLIPQAYAVSEKDKRVTDGWIEHYRL